MFFFYVEINNINISVLRGKPAKSVFGFFSYVHFYTIRQCKKYYKVDLYFISYRRQYKSIYHNILKRFDNIRKLMFS